MQTRRSFLRTATGAALALPTFESLQAAGTAVSVPQRFVIFYVPIGVVRRSFFPGEAQLDPVDFKDKEGQKRFREKFARRAPGIYPHTWTPTLKPLEKHAAKVTLITGLDRVVAGSSDVHEQAASCFLSRMAPEDCKGRKMPQDRTLDHVIADTIGNDTPFRTLEFSCNTHKDNKESIHFDNISWYGPDHVAPSMRDPRVAYRRMFGTQAGDSRKITDLAIADARDLNTQLGYSDRQKFGEYLESIRTIEKQMDRLTSMKAQLDTMNLKEPSEAHIPRGDFIRLMGDLMIAALQAGLTRVATMMIGPERWDTPYLFEEISKKLLSHHQMSHNQVQYARQLEQVDLFHMQQFAYLVERMDSIREPNGTTLLDNTLLAYGSGLGDGSTHQYDRLPIVTAGSGGGKLKTGIHVHWEESTPLANLWLTQTHMLGLDTKSFADNTCRMDVSVR